MRIAAIDIGTNSTRLLIADVNEEKIIPIFSDLKITRIGEGIGEKPFIKPEALKRTLTCLSVFKKICEDYKVDKIKLVATSAVRDAENKNFVKEKIYQNLGFKLEILSGSQEAKLSYLGAISDFNKENNVVVDIGGGSTEIVFPKDEGVEFKSINIGAVRLAEKPDLMDKVQIFLEENLKDISNKINLIGVGGTVTTLAAIKLKMVEYNPEIIHGQNLSFSEVKDFEKLLFDLSLEERKELKGLQPQRADIIPYGTYILKIIMELLGCSTLTVSEKDILYGMIITSLNGER